MKWQTMENAPRDGTNILLFTKCHGVVEAWFSQGGWHDYQEGREYIGAMWVCADDAFEIEVEECGQDCPDGNYLDGTATHWMPLPEPPETQS